MLSNQLINILNSKPNAIKDFQEELQILLAYPVFVDPYTITNINSSIDVDVTHDFKAKQFENQRIVNNQRLNYNQKFLDFFGKLNDDLRLEQDFKNQDYAKIFFNSFFENKKDGIDTTNDHIYVSSGEIDHSIFQMLFLNSLEKNRGNYLKLDSNLGGIPLTSSKLLTKSLIDYLSEDEEISRELQANTTLELKKDGYVYLDSKKEKKTVKEWLIEWGYWKGSSPSERFKIVLEFFKKIIDNTDVSKYFSLIDESNKKTHKTYGFNSDRLINKTQIFKSTYDKKDWEALTNLYFELIADWGNENPNKSDWNKRCRIRPYMHFIFRCFHYYFEGDKNKIESTSRSAVFLPILDTPESINKEEFHCGFLFVNFKDSKNSNNYFLNPNELSKFKDETIPSLYVVSKIIFKEKFTNFFSKIFEKQIQDIKQKSIKSSLAAVMARNQAHNISSHVLSRFSQESDISKESVLKQFKNVQFINDESIIKNKWEEIHYENYTKWLYNSNQKLEFIAVFNNYIKERQELLAEITSTVPLIQTNKSFREDVLKGFTDNQILLDRISGIDDFKFIFKLDIEIDSVKKEDVSVAIANDVLGQQALYIIFENIIRNTAKHSSKIAKDISALKKVVFTIRVRESSLNPSFYQITVFDDVKADLKNTELIKCESKEKKEFYDKHYKDNILNKKACDCFDENEVNAECIYGEVPLLTKLIIDQNILINKPILTKDNELRTEALGLIEMEACAAYLRKLPVEDIMDKEYKLKFLKKERKGLKEDIKDGKADLRILRAVNPINHDGLDKINEAEKAGKSDEEIGRIKSNLKFRENVLGYRFYLPKPQELLIIDADNNLFQNLDDNNLKEAQRQGVLILSTDTENINYKFDKEKIYPHEQLLIIGELDYNSAYLPKRRLQIDSENDLLNQFTNDEVNYARFKEDVLKKIVKEKCLANSLILKHKTLNDYYKDLIESENSKDFSVIEYSFDDHGTAYKKVEPNHHCQILTHKEKVFCKTLLEPTIEKADNIWSNAKYSFSNLSSVYKMFDSILNNVVVLDERIQEKAEIRYSLLKNKTRPDVSYREIWQSTGCFIPQKNEVDLSSSDFLETKDKIKLWLESLVNGKLTTEVVNIENRSYTQIDTLVIHIGVIEKCLAIDNKDKSCNKNKVSFIENILGANYEEVNVILTSGRAPRKENLIPDYSFLSISIITDYLIKNRFKYSLNELCNLARPKT